MRRDKVEDRLKRQLEELRVALPGVQIMFGFLLIAPFNQRFSEVTTGGKVVYGCALACAFAASMFLIAPSSFHRIYRCNGTEDEERMIRDFNRLAIIGGALLGAAVVAAVTFLAHFLAGPRVAAVAAFACCVLWLTLWYALPLWRQQRYRRDRRI